MFGPKSAVVVMFVETWFSLMILKATQQLNRGGVRLVWELLAPERPNADVCKKAHAASDALPGFWSGL